MRNSKPRPESAADVARQLVNVIAIPLGIAASFVLVPLDALLGSDPVTVPGATGFLPLARWAFAFRLVLFLGQLGYAFDQSLPTRRTSPVLRRIGWLTALDATLGVGWLAAWTAGRADVALGFLGASFLNLVAIELLRRDGARIGIELLLVRIPYSLALGWVGVLVLVEGAQFLQHDLGWDGAPIPPVLVAVGAIGVLTAIAATVAFRRPNLGIAVAVAWSLAGVLDAARGHAPALAVAALLGLVGITATALATIVVLARTPRRTSFVARALADA